jgi:ADP-heptose:LPS heptosyltransferase
MVSPFTGSTLKEWRKERDLMAAMPDVTFLMVGKKSASTGLDNVVSLGGRTTVTSLMSLMTLCDAGGFLDTGLMHVAGMVGTPYVAVFGGVHPPVEFTSLYDTVHTLSSRDHRAVTDMSTSDCSPCYLGKSGSCLGTEHERWCMRSIEIDEVGTKLREVLDGNGRRGPSKWSTPKGRPRKATKSVAVVCVGGFGDTLVALNTLRELSPKLRESYPSAEIDFVVRDDYRALKDLPWFDNWRAVSGGTTQAKSMEWCQSNYDLTIELKHGNPKSDPFGPDPIALVQSRNLGDLSFTPDGGTLTHHLDVLSPGRAEVARLSRVLPPEGEYVVLANGTDVTLGNLTKAVGGKFFGDLGRLIAEAGLTPVVVGVKGAGAVAIPGALDLVGKTSLGGLASVLRGARGVVSIDNGVVHLASQIGVPCVVLFGPTSAAFWGYEFNLNVTPEPNTCSEAPCWLTTRDWHTACKVDPMSTGTPACMGSYDAARIWALAGRYLEDRQLGGVVASS